MTRIAQTSLFALLFAAGTAHAAVIYVPAQVPTLPLAIQFAQNGDTIRVDGGALGQVELLDLQGKALTIESLSGSFNFPGNRVALLADGAELRANPEGGNFNGPQAEFRVPAGATSTIRSYQADLRLGHLSVGLGGAADLFSETVTAQLGGPGGLVEVEQVTISPNATVDAHSGHFFISSALLMPGSTLAAGRIVSGGVGPLIANRATISSSEPSFGLGDSSIQIEDFGGGSGWTLSESELISVGGVEVRGMGLLSAFDSELFLGADMFVIEQASAQLGGSFLSGVDVFIENVAHLDISDASLSVRDFVNESSVIGSGTWSTRMFFNMGSLVLTGDTLLTGAVENNGTITVQVGTLTIAGSFTDNGTVLGDLVGPLGGGMAVTGDYEAGAGATLAMPSSDLGLSVNGSFDVAIDDTARFDLDDASLAIGGLAGATLEAMSLDVGPFEDGLDGSRTGAFPMGSLTIRGTVDLVDAHPNSGSPGPESIYADALTIESGAMLNTNGIIVYYRTLSLDGVVDNPANLVPIDAGGVCPGDCDGNGTVDFNDLVGMLFEFGNATAPCDADGSGVVDFNDLVATLFLFGPCD